MKKILITGAGGFLGKYVTKQFALSGQYEVYAVISARGGGETQRRISGRCDCKESRSAT